MGLLGVLAAIVLAVGGVGSTVVLTHPDSVSALDSKHPVVAARSDNGRGPVSNFER